ncbi:hypothetical protein SEA_YARA_74 [Streptomyces phage Yara]|nr:hypothetical protein SEA_YARA_74 [Streptomyces phage Yara]
MKLTELLQKLTDVAEDLTHSGIDPNEVDVLVGVQPTYPLTNVVAGIISGEELADYCERPLDDLQKNAVWLAADAVPSGSPHSPYAPRPLWDAVS